MPTGFARCIHVTLGETIGQDDEDGPTDTASMLGGQSAESETEATYFAPVSAIVYPLS